MRQASGQRYNFVASRFDSELMPPACLSGMLKKKLENTRLSTYLRIFDKKECKKGDLDG